jgi:four helix bundle protein
MQSKKYLQLNDVTAYKNAFHLSNFVWSVVIHWDSFSKDTIGKQFVRAVDSISANIAEGFGRYGIKDKIKFYLYARASAKESLDWNEKAKIRQLIDDEAYQKIFKVLNELNPQINAQINITKQKLKQ